MNVVVLAGGLSTERDVSFKSGEMVAKALRENGHKALTLDVFMGYGAEGDDVSDIFDRAEEASIKVETIPTEAPDIEAIKASRPGDSKSFFGPNVIKICSAADIVFMALHGADGENGKVQAAFDLFGIKYTGNGYLSCAIAMDKGATKQYLANCDVPFPMGFSLKKDTYKEELAKVEVKYPVVVKPACGGSSIGVTIVHSEDEMQKALDDAFFWEDEVVVEEYIKGREFSCGVLKGKALPVIEIAPKIGFYDYKNKYAAGSAVETCPAEIPADKTAEMQLYAERVAEGLGLDTYSRMDFLMKENGEIYCLEANTLPGMTPTSLMPQEAAVIGMNYNELCEELIRMSLAKYE